MKTTDSGQKSAFYSGRLCMTAKHFGSARIISVLPEKRYLGVVKKEWTWQDSGFLTTIQKPEEVLNMSTSILYHVFGLKGITYQSGSYKGPWVVFRARLKDHFHRCPKCGSRDVVFKGNKTRHLILGVIGRKHCQLALDIHRIQCKSCGQIRWPKVPFADGKHRFVRSFALTVLDLLRFGTIQSVARYLDVSWDLIKEIHRMKLMGLYRRIPLHKVTYIGIDEFSIRRGHHYMTIFVDLKTGRILKAVEGKSKESIMPFLKTLATKAKRLKGIAMDMSHSYYWAVQEVLPNVAVIFDRYHVMSLMNQAVDEFRRDYQRQLDQLGQKTLKGIRFLLLRNYDRLDERCKGRLERLFRVNQPLYLMHTMKRKRHGVFFRPGAGMPWPPGSGPWPGWPGLWLPTGRDCSTTFNTGSPTV